MPGKTHKSSTANAIRPTKGSVPQITSRKGTNERFGGAEGKAGPLVRDQCIKNGLMVRAIRDTLVMSPPLIISHEEIDEVVALIGRSLDEVEPQLLKLEAPPAP